MNWHEFIFSTQSKHRIRRHLVSWILWWAFIILTVFVTPASQVPQGKGLPAFDQHQPGLEGLGFFSYMLLVLTKSFLLVLVHVFFCYSIIYVLLPAFQLKKNYWLLVSGIVITSSLAMSTGYYLYAGVYPAVDKLFGLHLPDPDRFIVFRSIDASLVNAVKVTLIAAAIALLKRWWVKQKEKEQLERERINAEVQLLKAQIHPAFLFSTLNNITSEARKASPKAPEMLIKLSDLLSYMLYECDVPKVELKREIVMLREYIFIEKIRQGERLELTFRINGNLNGQLISPLLLLPFIDYSLSYCNHELAEQVWLNLDITIENNNLSMKIINGIPPGAIEDARITDESMINVQKRLNLLYPRRHEVKITSEQELLMIHLNLKLEEATQTEETMTASNAPNLTYA
jgi:sensor histidine kinase YesM